MQKRAKNRKVQCLSGLLGAPRGPRGGPGGPCHFVLDPFVFDDPAKPSGNFWSFSWAPPWDPPEAQIHIKPEAFVSNLAVDRGPKMTPPRTPLGLRARPWSPPRPKKKCSLCARPPGDPLGGPGESKRAVQMIRAAPFRSGTPTLCFAIRPL